MISLCVVFSVKGQSKKDLKLNHVKSVTETTISLKDGTPDTWKSAQISYAKNGKVIEKIVYARDGSVQIRENFSFDTHDNLVEESYYSINHSKEKDKKKLAKKAAMESAEGDKPVTNLKYRYKYDTDGKLTEETELDGAGNVLSKTTYQLNSRGKPAVETWFSGDGKMLGKVVYSYNQRGLKIQEQSYGSSNELKETKNYEYRY